MKKRFVWIDNVKVFACILVVIGHFMQSMVKSGLMDNTLEYQFFTEVIYYFHVPLFFICSGYLFQRLTKIDKISDYFKLIKKKLIAIILPYVFFSTLTWVLKNSFSTIVNTRVDGLLTSLLVKPISPYWYLYTLFIFYLIVLPFKTNKHATCIFICSLILFIMPSKFKYIYMFSVVSNNLVWFVLGMIMCSLNFDWLFERREATLVGTIIGIFFILGCSFSFSKKIQIEPLFLSLSGCLSTILLIGYYSSKSKSSDMILLLARYTMPIYLMHTLIAAPIRIALIKLHCNSLFVHTVVGILGSVVGPIILSILLSYSNIEKVIIQPFKSFLNRRKL